MSDGFTLVMLLIATLALAVGTLILVSLRRSEPHRKWFYIHLTSIAIGWGYILPQLLALVGVPLVWQDRVGDPFYALMVVSLVLLYRHWHDPDPPESDDLEVP
jgi:hypothetical protein